MKRIGFLTLFVAAALASRAVAEQRVALVIGNAAYPEAELASPLADAKLVGDALEKAGFRVTRAENLKRAQFEAAIKDFARRTPVRGTALVFFSGYALADNASDVILLPLETKPLAPNHLGGDRPLGVRGILDQLRKNGGSAAHILLLDGSYRHPAQIPDYAAGAVEVGDFPEDSLAVYAAPFGQALEPPDEGTSPFATKLAAALNAEKSLREALDAVGPTRQTTLDSPEALTMPATRAVSDPNAGAKPGDEWVDGAGMVFCWIPPGNFTQGSPESEVDREADEAQAPVEIPRGFWMAKYEFTRGNLNALVGRPGTYLSTGDDKLIPLNKMRAADPEAWVAELNKTAPSGWAYALPTEAEWEYAARAGTATAYSFGNNPADLARFGNFADRALRESFTPGEVGKSMSRKPFLGDTQTGLFTYAHPAWNDGAETMTQVGSFPANPWGLHDIHGNLAELTATPFHAERAPPEKFDDKLGWVCKGGSWLSIPAYCRSAFRGQFTFKARENTTENFLGLRFILKRK